MDKYQWHVLPDSDVVAATVCHHIQQLATQAILYQGQFKIVLAGGTTPEKVYRLLEDTKTDWDKWQVYYGDERCLPKDHPDRNSQMAQKCFLSKVAIPAANIFTIPAELGPVAASAAYQHVVTAATPFDVVLLGMGEDGHTASLFPGHVHNTEEWVHAVYHSPKPPPERISLSLKVLSASHAVIIIVTGASKQLALKQWQSGVSLPVAQVQSLGTLDVYLDEAANVL
jgi:6-phosphogluconolactonase